ncbi:unnamed protein product, partial [marine sediment metagenome]
MTWFKIIEEDLIEWLQNYDGERYHAILADPPYALISITKRFGKEDSAPAQEGVDGLYRKLSGGFMGQTWDGFASLDHYREWVKTWAKLLIEKALYPGAVCLFFGGTRTWHHLALGLEQGGFEVYDTMMFLYGSGFPKSHNVGKGIEKGNVGGIKNLKIIGHKKGIKTESGVKGYSYSEQYVPGVSHGGKQISGDIPIYEINNAWGGYGTALKPAWEPIIVCRTPRKGATFASLALEHGSGALN